VADAGGTLKLGDRHAERAATTPTPIIVTAPTTSQIVRLDPARAGRSVCDATPTLDLSVLADLGSSSVGGSRGPVASSARNCLACVATPEVTSL
jgi:hypothetical protein